MTTFAKTATRLAAAVGLAALILALAPHASALGTNETEIFYLDGNGHEVGYYFRGCDGTRIRQGQTTTTMISYTGACQNPPVENLRCYWQGSYSSCAANMFWDLCTSHFSPTLCRVDEP